MCVGGNILGANRSRSVVVIDNNFDVVIFVAETVVVGGGRRNHGRIFVGDEAYRTAVADEETLVFHGEFPSAFGASFGRIVGKAESDFASRKGKEVISKFFFEYTRTLNTATDACEVGLGVAGDNGEIWR